MNDYRELELLISYYQDRLMKLPQGYFGRDKDAAIVYVTHVPGEQPGEKRKRFRYRLTSEKGQKWADLVREYRKCKDKLDELMTVWNSTYRFPPRKIAFPLVRRDPSMFTADFFNAAAECANPAQAERPIEYKGRILRSKNELIGCQIIEKLGYEFKVEIAVGSDPFYMLYPDITFLVPEQERCIGVEINGAVDNIKYANKSLNRQSEYIKNGLMISKDVIFVDIADSGSFYVRQFETQVKLAVMAGLDDIIFPDKRRRG